MHFARIVIISYIFNISNMYTLGTYIFMMVEIAWVVEAVVDNCIVEVLLIPVALEEGGYHMHC